MNEANQDMPVFKEPFNLLPFERTATKMGQVTFKNFGETKVLNQSELVKELFTKGLLVIYEPEDLVGVEDELPKKKGFAAQELISSMLKKADAEKFKEERKQANEKLGSFDFSQPDEIFKFIMHFGLFEVDSPLQKITEEIYGRLPLSIKQALAIKAF